VYLSRIYGCVVASDLDLHLTPLPADAPADLTLRRAEDEWDPGWKPEPADLISDYWNEAGQEGYLSARIAGGYRLRFHDICEYDLSSGLDEAVWRTAPGVKPGLVAAKVPGALMALKLVLAGELVLHASAVSVGGRGLAFVGRSGMGKSTLATLMCRAGALMVTDDVGRVIFDADGVRLAAGGHESRLRATGGGLVDLMPGLAVRNTSDGWLALSMTRTTAESVALDAVVIPLPTSERTALKLHTKTSTEIVILLNRFPRLFGLQDATLIERQFQQLVDLAERVPVFTATIPWGPSYQPGAAAELIRELGWDPLPG
jgi:hypothetical protein